LETTSTARCRGRTERRKCLYCKGYFTPDRRNRYHQQYCSKPGCRYASKKASQQKWRSSSKGADYFSGQWNVTRVQQWRQEHPGYWKNTVPGRPEPLQDVIKLQNTDIKYVTKVRDLLRHNALQDVSFLQPALFVGLIASLTGSTLQDDIAQTTRRFIDSGRDILCNATKPPSR
jgi:hypothetical protein